MVPLLSQEKAQLLPEESTVKLVNLLISLVLVCAGVFMLNYVKQSKKGKWFNLTVIYSALYVERGSADRKKGKWPEILAIFGHFLMGCVIGAVTWQYSNRFFGYAWDSAPLFDGYASVIWNADAFVICLHIIHYSLFIIHSSVLPRLDSFRHSLRSCHLPQERGYFGSCDMSAVADVIKCWKLILLGNAGAWIWQRDVKKIRTWCVKRSMRCVKIGVKMRRYGVPDAKKLRTII